jgi:hypothetical protein
MSHPRVALEKATFGSRNDSFEYNNNEYAVSNNRQGVVSSTGFDIVLKYFTVKLLVMCPVKSTENIIELLVMNFSPVIRLYVNGAGTEATLALR